MFPRLLLPLALSLALPLCAHAQDSGLRVRQDGHGATIISVVPVKPPPAPPQSFELARGAQGLKTIGRLSKHGSLNDADLPAFAWDGETLVHRHTGVRLPKVHDGCRLAALAPYKPPRAGAPIPYDDGARAEYDCGPGDDLTYVDVVFERGYPLLVTETKAEGLQMGAAHVASEMIREEARVHGTPCSLMDLKTEPGHVNRDLTAAQCGVKWAKPSDPKQLYGSAAYVLARGTTYVGFLNTCAGAQCATDRPKFGHFLDTFDLRSVEPTQAP